MKLVATCLLAEKGLSKGDQVKVDGLPGRGIVLAVKGRRVTVKFRNGEYISRDQIYVHSLDDNTYVSRYMSDTK